MKRVMIILVVILTTFTSYSKTNNKDLLRRAVKLMKLNETIYGEHYADSQWIRVSLNPKSVLKKGKVYGKWVLKGDFVPMGDLIEDKPYSAFKKAIAFRESSDNWKSVNQCGYIGLYQFGPLALKDCNVDVDAKTFKKNPDVFPKDKQDKVFDKWVSLLIRYVRPYINDYNGRVINGIEITPSGLVAAAHLVGAGGVKIWLESNGSIDVKDGNGTSISEYVELFGGYDLDNTTYYASK